MDIFKSTNPWTLRDMAERLLEAHQRGLWQQVSPELLAELRMLVLQVKSPLESQRFL